MSDHKQQQLNSKAVPFFARYLEGQLEDLSEKEAQAVGGGLHFVTKRYPSDNEDGGSKFATTMKYPSDNEDGGSGSVTEKYPSDQEDIGDIGTVTWKYPSGTSKKLTFPKFLTLVKVL